MKLRVARHTDRLEAVVAFYRDRVGLPETGRFVDHRGYDGVFLDIPGTASELEFTTGAQSAGQQPDPESLLVFYLQTQAERQQIVERIAAPAVSTANPYWNENAIAFADPDGFLVVLALAE